jgi:hypothetical protein
MLDTQWCWFSWRHKRWTRTCIDLHDVISVGHALCWFSWRHKCWTRSCIDSRDVINVGHAIVLIFVTSQMFNTQLYWFSWRHQWNTQLYWFVWRHKCWTRSYVDLCDIINVEHAVSIFLWCHMKSSQQHNVTPGSHYEGSDLLLHFGRIRLDLEARL